MADLINFVVSLHNEMLKIHSTCRTIWNLDRYYGSVSPVTSQVFAVNQRVEYKGDVGRNWSHIFNENHHVPRTHANLSKSRKSPGYRTVPNKRKVQPAVVCSRDNEVSTTERNRLFEERTDLVLHHRKRNQVRQITIRYHVP